MSSPRQQIAGDIQEALKAGDKERLSTLRMLLSAIDNERIRRGEPIDESAFYGLVRKGIKQRHDSSEQYAKGGREELAAREQREAEILSEYLPPAVDEAELAKAIRQLIAAEDLAGPQAMGRVMKEMLNRFSGRTDGGTINRLAREILAEK